MAGSPSNWTQEAANNLTAIARDTAWAARYDVNPVHGKRQSAVRCESPFGHDVMTLCQHAWSLIAGNGVDV